MAEFYRMCNHYGWRGDKDKDGHYLNPEREVAGKEFKNALTLQFNAIYGTDENSLVAWQNLCIILNLGDVPEELHACRKVGASQSDQDITKAKSYYFNDPLASPLYVCQHG
jgi:hypothetical protein